MALTPLHVLTACSRPAYLPAIAQCLASARQFGIDVHWHIGLDLEKNHPGGQAVKNALLDRIADGWVWICDDDNLPHPRFFATLAGLDGQASGYLFAQNRGPGGFLRAQPPVVDRIDAAQAIVARWAIGDMRLPAEYTGDGQWLAALHAAHPLTCIDTIVTYYNASTWNAPVVF